MNGHTKLNLVGCVYGNLRVIKEAHSVKGKTRWVCKCKCGTVSIKATSDLRRKRRIVAGCSIKCPMVGERISLLGRTHGMSKHLGFYSYRNMLSRCYNPKNCKWERYGGRGISVCDQWRHSFENFWMDMGTTWKQGLTIHRKNNDGNYSKTNCCWATYKTQALNRCNSISVEDAPIDFREEAIKRGVKISTFYWRVKNGRNWAQVLGKPYQFRNPTINT